jgi:hypothetical protein
MALKVIAFLVFIGIVIKTIIGLEKKSNTEVFCNMATATTLAVLITKF